MMCEGEQEIPARFGVFRPGTPRDTCRLLCLSGVLACLSTAGSGHATTRLAHYEEQNLADLSLAELAVIPITSVARKPTPLSQTSASIYVISARDIQRAGAASLPEALRLAPNLTVARIDANRFAISARGFNTSTTNKLQVLIDGRIVYTPLYSGVFWDAQDVLMEDIERIEVISGPNAAMWGANAVNGLINVITRHSADSEGNLIKGVLGEGRRQLAFRHGSAVNEQLSYRIYAKADVENESELADGGGADDGWQRGQLGFRMDWRGAGDSLRVQGDAYRGDINRGLPQDTDIAGANVQLHWKRELEGSDSVSLRAYHDYRQRDIPATLSQHLNITHLELQHNLSPGADNSIQWGADYRLARDRISNAGQLAFLPERKQLRWASVFAQDELAVSDDWRLTLNGRLEHNDYSGLEFMPSVRLAWQQSPRELWWAALSRAVRSPSRIDTELFFPAQPPFQLTGGEDFRGENALVSEVGYRATFNQVSYALTMFHARYDDLRSVEAIAGGAVISNGLRAVNTGLESWVTWQPAQHWRVQAALLLMDVDVESRAGFSDLNGGRAEGNDPSFQGSLRVQYDIDSNKAVDLLVRHMGALPAPPVPSYTAVDLRFGWAIQPALEWSLVARNLFDDSHPEFGSEGDRSEIERNILMSLTWNF